MTDDFGDAGWSSPVARQAHNLKVVSSNLAPATKYENKSKGLAAGLALFFLPKTEKMASPKT